MDFVIVKKQHSPLKDLSFLDLIK